MSSIITRLKPLPSSLLTVGMTVYGYLSAFMLSFTIARFFIFLALLPPYLLKVTFQVLPTLLKNCKHLLHLKGWNYLVLNTEEYRNQADRRASSQLDGEYTFGGADVYRIERHGIGWMDHVPWADDTKEILVCGATARFVRLKPSYTAVSPGHHATSRTPIVFLHGNPSWSYMWRNILPRLLERGHDVYALDWLGHGRSDKIIHPDLINFELHMRTLKQFFQSTGIANATIVAHDWGGCVALCTLPELPPSTCSGLFLLNSFFPPRFSELSLHYGLLYGIWFLSTGILGGYLPESAVMRFMSPELSQKDVENYGAPYRHLPVTAKSSVYRFGHIVPGTPRVVLRWLRETWLWKLGEGLCGPENFDNLTAQSRLSARDQEIRPIWKGIGDNRTLQVAVVFGDGDPLLSGYKEIIVQALDQRLLVDWAPNGVWLGGAGHYAGEEKPEDIASLIARFAQS